MGKDLPAAGRKALRDKLSGYKRILVCVTEHRLAAYQSFFAEFAPDVPVVYVCFIPGKQLPQIRQGISAAEAVVLAHSSNDGVQRQVAGYFMRMPWLTAGFRQVSAVCLPPEKG